MTFNEAVEVILLDVNGGNLSLDSRVLRPEVEAYLSSALASAIVQYWFKLKADQRADAANSGAASALPVAFYQNVQLDLAKYDTSLYQAMLPRLIGVPGALGSVYSTKAEMAQVGSIQSIWKFQEYGMPAYFVRQLTSGDEQQVLLSGCYAIKDTIWASGIFEITCMTHPNTTMPVPPEIESEAINMCIQKFNPQRAKPDDHKPDGHDVDIK